MMSDGSKVRLITIYAVLSIITNFPSGFANSTLNTAVEELNRFIKKSLKKRGFSSDESSVLWVQSATLNCWFVAQIFGSMLTPLITDVYGRKFGYVTCQVVTIFSSFLQYFAVETLRPELFIFGRSLTAMVSPLGDACLLLYIQETSPMAIRGMSSFLCEIGYSSMCLLGMALGMRNVLGYSLQYLLLVTFFVESTSLVILLFIPETPKFLLIMRDDEKAAQRSLEFFQGPKSESRKLLIEYEVEKLDENDDLYYSSFKELFGKWHVRQAIKLATAVLVLTLSFYPILQSSTYFFLKSGVPTHLAETSSTLMTLILTCSSFIGAGLIDTYPRRVLIIFFGIISNALLVLFAFCSDMAHSSSHEYWRYSCLASLFAYCVSFGMVLGPISWFVAPELVSQRHKSTVFSVCFAVHNLLITLTDFATLPTFRAIGGASFILLFVIPSSFCLFYIYFYMPETLAKETHEIVFEMMMRDPKRTESDCVTPSFQVRPRMFSTPSAVIRFY